MLQDIMILRARVPRRVMADLEHKAVLKGLSREQAVCAAVELWLALDNARAHDTLERDLVSAPA